VGCHQLRDQETKMILAENEARATFGWTLGRENLFRMREDAGNRG
jgi:hypothetical protein